MRRLFSVISRLGDGVFWYVLMGALVAVDERDLLVQFERSGGDLVVRYESIAGGVPGVVADATLSATLTVGTSGRTDERFSENTARPRILPPLICGTIAGRAMAPPAIWLPSTSPTMKVAPL